MESASVNILPKYDWIKSRSSRLVMSGWELVGGGGGRSGTVCGRSPGCFCWVLLKRGIPKPDQHRKCIIQQESFSLQYVVGTDEQQLHKISH